MDLAKIRKKSIQLLEDAERSSLVSVSTGIESVQKSVETVLSAPISSFVDPVANELPVAPVSCAAEVPPAITAVPPVRTAVLTPIEAIMAGRAAAGCDDESVLADDDNVEVVAESNFEFLIFRVSDEIYGINIMDIKEIIKPREVTEVPRAPLFVSGILSLRGTIIPIIDMRMRLGLAGAEVTGKERIVVIKCDNSLSGLLVDEVIQVVKVARNEVEAAPTVLDGIDRDFVSGLGRSDGRLIIILNLQNIADINLY
jgi:purine-binding chemotaxis protein CheW